ncbi:MAG: hypothetical protein OIF35_10670, partial [Cellvibrionaceae bacterium]|nr:hypothetical protein [Cellvibrionaceae bacterium]
VAVLLGPSLIQQPVPLPQPEQGADYMLETEELAPSFAAPQSIVADEPVAESVTMPRPKVVPMSQMTAKRKSSEETKSVPLSQQLESLAQRLQRDPEGAERAYQQLRRWCPELPAKLSQALAQLEAGQYPSYCPSAAGP